MFLAVTLKVTELATAEACFIVRAILLAVPAILLNLSASALSVILAFSNSQCVSEPRLSSRNEGRQLPYDELSSRENPFRGNPNLPFFIGEATLGEETLPPKNFDDEEECRLEE